MLYSEASKEEIVPEPVEETSPEPQRDSGPTDLVLTLHAVHEKSFALVEPMRPSAPDP